MTHQVPTKEDLDRMKELGFYTFVFLEGRRAEAEELMQSLYRPAELKKGPQRDFHERMLLYDILSIGWMTLKDRAAQMQDRDEND